jgi:sulfite exporter TauE/SafE
MEVYFSIAFFTGLASSLHCIGMCGPIALALPVGRLNKAEKLLAKLLYNLGRILTYSLLGLFFGYFGKQFFIAGWQQIFSISIGFFLLFNIIPNKYFPLNFSSKIGYQFSPYFKKILKIQYKYKFLFFGILNGLLPCGMVYLALAGAMATATPYSGAMFMVFFGLGTLPLMLSVSILPSLIKVKFRQRINRILPYYSVFLILIFVIRGLGLGLPYLSPKIFANETKNEITICHGQ